MKRLILITTGVMVMLSLFGCGGQKYRLNYDGSGFESKKTEYAAGEKVTVRYDIIATDTDYVFSIDDDVNMKQDFDGGYVFTFTMPEHDVTLHVESYNSMVFVPETESVDQLSQEEIAAELDEGNMIFDYYSGVTATDGGDGYDELVLYKRTAGDGLILAQYHKWGEGEEERHMCIVPESVLYECMDTVERYQIADWDEGPGLTGAYYVVKFMDGDKLIRKSSDDMPEDGMAALDEISYILSNAWGMYAQR